MSMRKTFSIVAILTLTIFGTNYVGSKQADAAPATFTVNVTTDEGDANAGDGICETSNAGECTLRAAIEEANANTGADTIEFNIPGSGVHLIQPSSSFPIIIEALTIDGYTNNPGATPNSAVSPAPINSVLNIELDNSNNLQNPGLVIGSDDVTIKGIAIDGFPQAIWINEQDNVDNVTISGNYLNTDTTGLSPNSLSESQAVTLTGNCSNITVGGSNPADRNILTASNAVVETRCSYVSVLGNYFGIGRDGLTSIVDEVTPESNGIGINQVLNSSGPPYSNLTVGGPNPGEANVISGFPGTLMVLAGINNIIQGNILGGDYTGNENSNLNTGAGIVLYAGGSNNLVGGTDPGEGNVIVGAKGAAIALLGIEIPAFNTVLAGQDNVILGNRIFNVGILPYYNFGDSNIGIDLITGAYDNAPSGPPQTYTNTGPNDTADGNDISKVNSYLKSPVLNSAVQVGDNLEVNLDLDVIGSDSNEYRVEFFSNDVSTVFGYGPGQNYLGAATVDTGISTINLDLGSNADITNKALSATVTPLDSTGPSGFGGTSEFSQNIEIGSATDFDADGISDSVEDGAPNNGDANDDGIQDSQQPKVSSYLIGSTYVSFTINNGCSANGSVESLTESNLQDTDQGFTYPFGLTDFTLNCSKGETVNVEKIVFTNDTADGYSVRKYRPNTHTFEAVPGSNVEEQTIGGQSALVLTYDITDGGPLDDDGIENGIILDPVGLAAVFVSSTPGVSNTNNPTTKGTLAATGAGTSIQTSATAMWLLIIGAILVLFQKKRYPVLKARI